MLDNASTGSRTAFLTLADLREELNTFAHEALRQVVRDTLRDVLREQKFGSGVGSIGPGTRSFRLSQGALALLYEDDDGASKRKRFGQMRSRDPDYAGRRSRRGSLGKDEPPSDITHREGRDSVVNGQYTEATAASRASVECSGYVTLVTPREASVPIEEAQTLQQRVFGIVTGTVFEHVVGLLVLLNAVCLGFETQYLATHLDDRCYATDLSELFFCTFFTLEICMRLFVFNKEFFTMEGSAWNVFDLSLVLLQVMEQILKLLSMTIAFNMAILRLLRILRVIRVARLVRAVHLFDELRVITSSIAGSTSTLLWSMVLLAMMIYIFSLVFMQIILSYGETPHHEAIHYWFGSLFRTLLTMFECIVGGISWDEVVAPLVSDISPAMGTAFCIYIALCLFAMMNLVTGVFVDQAMRSVREDKDQVLAKRISQLFLTTTSGRNPSEGPPAGGGEITWEDFEDKLQSGAMQEYFKQINVDISEARQLFELLDADGSGSIDSAEIVDGCLRLRGPARSLELSLMARDLGEMSADIAKLKQALLLMD